MQTAGRARASDNHADRVVRQPPGPRESFKPATRCDRTSANRHCKVARCACGDGYQPVAKKDATGAPPKQGNAAHSLLYLPGLKAEVSRAFA